MLDEYDVRGRNIRVQRAQFEMKGEYNPALKPKRKKQDKEKLKKLQEKWVVSMSTHFPILSLSISIWISIRLLDWRPDKLRGQRSKHERIVILKNLFAPDTFVKEVSLILDYQNEMREECTKYGKVKKVIIYDVSIFCQATMSLVEIECGLINSFNMTSDASRGRGTGEYERSRRSRHGCSSDEWTVFWRTTNHGRNMGWKNQVQVSVVQICATIFGFLENLLNFTFL